MLHRRSPRKSEWSIRLVDVGAGVQQSVNASFIVTQNGSHQGRLAAAVGVIGIGAGPNEVIRHPDTTIFRRPHQGGFPKRPPVT